jgi:cephalosporin-C deacetylase
VQSDLDLDDLRAYRSVQTMPDDFVSFWAQTMASADAAARPSSNEQVDVGTVTLDTYDVTFSGWKGQPIRAWWRKPKSGHDLMTVVQFVGYGGGRGLPTENLLWASSGFGHLLVDTRGQGSVWSLGDTSDPDGSDPAVPGFLTRGILSPEAYYYRRVFSDAVRAVDTVAELPGSDPSRIVLVGGSQGGAIALAAASLSPKVRGVSADVPFLCDLPRAVRIHDSEPYAELVRYLAVHRGDDDRVAATLAYFDVVNFARRAVVPARFTVALMDEVCKPSTVFAAYNEYAGPKEIEVHRFNGHEGGGAFAEARAIAWAKELLM